MTFSIKEWLSNYSWVRWQSWENRERPIFGEKIGRTWHYCEFDKISVGRCLVNPIIIYWKCLFFMKMKIFNNLKQEIVLAIPASNEWKIETSSMRVKSEEFYKMRNLYSFFSNSSYWTCNDLYLSLYLCIWLNYYTRADLTGLVLIFFISFSNLAKSANFVAPSASAKRSSFPRPCSMPYQKKRYM